MDYTSEFTTDEVYKSKADLLEWVRQTGKNNGFILRIIGSDLGTASRKKPRLTLGCERSGFYKPYKEPSEFKRNSSGTKKCGCPFRLKGKKLATGDDWMLEVVCGMHNHPAVENFEGHSYAGRLNEEETSLLLDMSKTMSPKEILDTLKARNPDSVTTMKTIYNTRQKYKVAEKATRSQIQYLLGKLIEYNYIEWHRNFNNDSNTVADLVWAHPTSIDLLCTFPRLLLLDATYKINRHGHPFFEILGVTSTNIAFSVAFVFLARECIENYIWALERLRSIIESNDCGLPDVVVTNSELTLMRAVEIVFPSARHLLCKYQVEKNVLAKCKKLIEDKDTFDQFVNVWKLITGSKSDAEYKHHVELLTEHFRQHPEVIQYVLNDWLNPYHDRFVEGMTTTCMHFGNTSTNRAESGSHSNLKHQLECSLSNMETGWLKIHSSLEMQFANINASFEKSMTDVQHEFNLFQLRELRGFVSTAALDLIVKQCKRADQIGVDPNACGCLIRCTHGLPCAHEIAIYNNEGRPIPLYTIESHWTHLHIIPAKTLLLPEIDFAPKLEAYKAMLQEYDDHTRMQILEKLREVFHPHITPVAQCIEDTLG